MNGLVYLVLADERPPEFSKTVFKQIVFLGTIIFTTNLVRPRVYSYSYIHEYECMSQFCRGKVVVRLEVSLGRVRLSQNTQRVYYTLVRSDTIRLDEIGSYLLVIVSVTAI